MADEQKPAEKPEPSIRKKLQLARMAKVRKAKEKPRVRVSPIDDTVRVNIKHPRAGAFRSTGSNEWPDDTFTQRRIKEGSVTLEPSRDRPPPDERPHRASRRDDTPSNNAA
jgi:hypothetical protein